MSSTTNARAQRGQPLSEETRVRLREAVDRDGVVPTAKRLGISTNAVARAMAGLPQLEGTRLVVSTRL